jgi:hypothetical protein
MVFLFGIAYTIGKPSGGIPLCRKVAWAATGAIRDAIKLALAEWPAIQAAANERRWSGEDDAPLLSEDRGNIPCR